MDIELRETKKLTIQNMYEVPLNTLVTNHALSGGNLMWTDRILFSFASFPVSDKQSHEAMDGIFHWSILEYSLEMKEYSPTLKADKLNQEVPVFDMSYHPFYKQLKKFVLQNKNK